LSDSTDVQLEIKRTFANQDIHLRRQIHQTTTTSKNRVNIVYAYMVIAAWKRAILMFKIEKPAKANRTPSRRSIR